MSLSPCLAITMGDPGLLPAFAGGGGGVVLGIVSGGDFRGLEHDRLDHQTGLSERIA